VQPEDEPRSARERTETEVQAAIDRLKLLSLVVESSGGASCVTRRISGACSRIPTQAVALLAGLMLRGPQTAAELRINCERLHRFAYTSAAEAFLQEIAARQAGPSSPSFRGNRARARRVGAPLVGAPSMLLTLMRNGNINADGGTPSEIAALQANVAQLRAELSSLQAVVEALRAEIGANR
jgi:uncharacterized protein YceH (UPF0502 family)